MGASNLNPRQAHFVEEYLSNGYNATQAALAAGYSPDTAYSQGHDNLKHPEIARLINERKQSLAERCGLTDDWIVKQLLEEATSTAPGTTGASRIRALELLAKVRGMSVMEQAAALEAAGFTITLKRDDRREQPVHANAGSSNTSENEGVT